MTTVINAYADQKIADMAVAALRKEGLSDQQARILGGDTKALLRELSEYGFADADAQAYAEAVKQGQTLVIASISEERADWALSIMDRILSDHGSLKESSAGSVPIVEEELSVSKARSANGGVRVTSRVVETPVEETVTLTTETVGVKRHAANRVLEDDEAAAVFEEKTVEMMGTEEEVEVRKEARVVGEVELTKEVEAHQKTIKDTVRKTEVEVEEVGVRATKK
ncbi:YsnF/AvaK domain-containing protein [Paracoccus sp. MC1862]|uniref:YsnF/AvaK domain-containing protein n=1 Tax=Paracoccus sp. MC1862 TaxID=2760307 RepID=UPI001600B3C3|nr:YsnF/AvaK domain-containing protein [Paracoccus sp. MC1862]MBB1499356.1 YsnF/AvaK domain-containing protein [Paracoccus sp. MC1862]